MKQTINFYEFERQLKDIRPDSFTYDGLKIMFDYLEEIEMGGLEGFEVEFDAIAIDCEFTEYASLEDLLEDYSHLDNVNLDVIRGRTTVREVPHATFYDPTAVSGYIVTEF